MLIILDRDGVINQDSDAFIKVLTNGCHYLAVWTRSRN